MFTKINVASGLLALAPFVNALPQADYYAASATPVQPAVPEPPVRSSQVTGATSHGPFSGSPTTTGALSLSVLAASIPALPPNPTATTYPSDGQLHDPQPAPFVPAGGLGTNGTEPIYNVRSDFDYESLVRGCPLLSFQSMPNMFRLLRCTKNGSSWICSTTASADLTSLISRPQDSLPKIAS